MTRDHRAVTFIPIRGNEIPARNRYFTGRETLLSTLRKRLTSGNVGVLNHPPQAFFGLGGIGKTAIATEYTHRYGSEYQLIWWIPAENAELISDSFVRLGRRLGLEHPERDKMIWMVQDLLSHGQYQSWLLVFDNAEDPATVKQFLPGQAPRGGHVIITSRQRHWRAHTGAEGIDVTEFEPRETIDFLRGRVPDLGPSDDPETDAERLAEAAALGKAMGNLPLAVEHAAAYLTETGVGVQEFLAEFEDDAHRVMSRPVDIAYQYQAIATTWSMTANRLSSAAREIFRLAAYFSSEPIAEELFVKGAEGISRDTLREALTDPARTQSALHELNRFSLIELRGKRKEIRLHRVVQAVMRSQLRIDDPEAVAQYREAVHRLLAEADPGKPDLDTNIPAYDRIIQHLGPTGAIHSGAPELRQLIINQVRRLHLFGRHQESLRLGQDALRVWRESLGADDPVVLRLATEVGMALRLTGRNDEAAAMNEQTLSLAQNVMDTAADETRRDEARRVWLLCANSHGADLRYQGLLHEALELDLKLLPQFVEVFGARHERTLNVRNNVAVDYRRLGDFAKALKYDEETLADREELLGPANPRTLASKEALSRDLRGTGRYIQSCDIAREVVAAFDAHLRGESPDSLNARKSFGVALRKAGFHDDALEVAEAVYASYTDYLGPEHRYTLSAAANLIVDLRVAGELARARELGGRTVELCAARERPPGNITFAAQVNYAAVLRQFDHHEEARELDEKAWRGLRDLYGERHPFVLITATNLASDLFGLGELAEARALDEETLALGVEVRPANHPNTLATAVNLSVDLRHLGETAAADELLARTLNDYRLASIDHLDDARAARRKARVTLDLEA